MENSSMVWMIAGLLLCSIELLLPGIFLLFFGAAALGVALALAFYPLNLASSLIVFAILALLSVWAGRLFYGHNKVADNSAINKNPAQALVGRELVLTDPIVNGIGQARVLDSVWRVSGHNAPAGALVRVTNIESGGLVLRVDVIEPESHTSHHNNDTGA